MPEATSGSKKYRLNRQDMKRVGLGASVACGGAVLTYLAEIIPGIDFGVWTPIVMAVFSILVNAARKFLTDYSE